MPKVDIYLPDDLAEEARAAKLSLSPLCQRAIREKLHEMKVRKPATSDIKTVAKRLNDTISEDEAKRYQKGLADGSEWAGEFATADQLRWIVQDSQAGSGGPFDAGHSLCAFMSTQENANIVSVDHEADDPYWQGFIDGSGEVLEVRVAEPPRAVEARHRRRV